MKYRTLKRITKRLDEVHTREKETDEIHIESNGVYIEITEQQVGIPLQEPHIYIAKGYMSVSMDMSTFLKRVGINIKEDQEK